MTVRPTFPLHQQMTIAEFLAFTATRPDEERWELIEGVPVLNASPVEFHQVVAMNIGTFLMNEKRRLGASWLPMLGVGTRVPASPNSLPQPDVFVKAGPATGRPDTDDALVLFEILSRSNTKADQLWRRRVYASIPNCQHYVTVSLKRAEAVAYDRSSGWDARKVNGLESAVSLDAIGVTLPLADVYRYTPTGAS
jgi:Uma2 family endonuclease